MRPSRAWLAHVVLALFALGGGLGCNAILGNDDGVYVPGAGAGAGGAGVGGAGTGGTGTGGTGTGGGATGGGGASTCPPDCTEGCFEGVCNGWAPVDIAAGTQVGCVVVKSGSVFCVGANRYGALATPPTDPSLDECLTGVGGITVPCSHTPRKIPLPGAAGKVTTAFNGACAALHDGRLFCWGNNDAGQLGHPPGDGGDETYDGSWIHPQPVQVDLPTPVQGVATISGSAPGHACAIAGDPPVVHCWGKNDYGGIGNGSWSDTAIEPPSPVKGLGGEPWAIAVGTNTCALLGNATHDLVCWGASHYGAGGEVATEVCSGGVECVPQPTSFPGAPPIANSLLVALPRQATCPLVVGPGGPALRCAGWNGEGVLGSVPDELDHPTLGAVAGIDDAPVLSVSAGDMHVCAVLSGGDLRCWGDNESGQLGNGAVGTAVGPCTYVPCEHTPQAIDVGGAAVARVSAAPYVTWALTGDGRVFAWGLNQGAQLGHPPSTGGDLDTCSLSGSPIVCNPTPTLVQGLPGPDS